MNALAIGCHPDDIEIACCGTLAKCVKRGDKVAVCHVANGNMGHEIIPPDELRVIRADEIELKMEMLEYHESQLKWMRDHDHIDFADFVRTCSKLRGYQCGVDYAEGFCQEIV